MQDNCVLPSIVVTGIAGSGKTTLINRLSGSTTEGDHDLQHVGQLQSTPCSLGDYEVVLWETPDIIAKKAETKEYPKPQVVVLCIDITTSRFALYHDQVIKKMSHSFNKNIWKMCIIVLTFSDQLTQKPSWKGYNNEKKKEKFSEEVSEWTDLIRKKLASIDVPEEVIKKIPFISITCIPTDTELINAQNSLDKLKSACKDALQASIDTLPEISNEGSSAQSESTRVEAYCVKCYGCLLL